MLFSLNYHSKKNIKNVQTLIFLISRKLECYFSDHIEIYLINLSLGSPIVELQVTKVTANMTKTAYDTKVGLTVHSLLVVDALQTYGPDFELLVASHKNVR